MKKISWIKIALPLLFCIAGQAQESAAMPKFVPLTNINTEESPVVQSYDSTNPIYTVNGRGNNSGKLFRPPPGSPYSVQGSYGDPLIYVAPGGLEPDSNGYLFPFSMETNDPYQPMSFSFSGTAASLVLYSETGWGTENNAGGFMPYLVKSDYRNERRPYYEFFWSPKEKFSTAQGITKQLNANITLNYVFKIPAQTEVKWGTENSFTRFTFAGGPPISEQIQSDKVFKWAQGSIGSTDAISNMSNPSSWQIPDGLENPAGFAVSADGNIVFAAAGKTLTAFSQDGAVKWQASGSAPLITYGDSGLLAMSADYRAIQYIDTASGRVLHKLQIPPFLPRENNTFALASCRGNDYLFLQVPEQSTTYAFKAKKSGD
ncbi:MAG: hypothetical protein A2020_03580 [Lentisphaerae bacterium GWF2_45_14]|nr:MAG: hypothetical protein A2020_03580 [Lentisphaerae bacterium GWF2_45_14]